MRFLAYSALLLFGLVAPPLMAQPTSGRTDYQPQKGDSLQAIRARPLSEGGSDAIRYSASPSLGGATMIVELFRRDEKGALGTAYFLYGHPSSKWHRLGELKIHLTISEFVELAEKFDKALAAAKLEMAAPLPPDTIPVCADGTASVAERRANRTSFWIRSTCGLEAIDVIGKLMANAVKRSFNRYVKPLER